MSTLTVAIPDPLDAALAERVSATGARSKEEYVLGLVEADCAVGRDSPEQPTPTTPTVAHTTATVPSRIVMPFSVRVRRSRPHLTCGDASIGGHDGAVHVRRVATRDMREQSCYLLWLGRAAKT